MRGTRWLGVGGLAALACTPEYRVQQDPPPPPAEPPGETLDELGDPPADWTSCDSGFLGLYANLPADHPDVEPALDAEISSDPDAVDWFDDRWRAFSRFDPSLDWGEGWWPVDEGLAGDPLYFSVRWTGWMRVWSSGTHSFLLGAGGDAWMLLDGAVVAELHELQGYAGGLVELNLESGVYPVELRYAHRSEAADGMRFRVVSSSEEVRLCYPEFG